MSRRHGAAFWRHLILMILISAGALLALEAVTVAAIAKALDA